MSQHKGTSSEKYLFGTGYDYRKWIKDHVPEENECCFIRTKYRKIKFDPYNKSNSGAT
jgi:hypothetical protein